MIKYPNLFRPIEIAGVLFRSRIFAAPTGWQDLPEDGTLPPEAAEYYARKAKGGAAAVTLGECIIDSELGSGGAFHIRMDNKYTVHSLARCAAEISRRGGVASCELQHSGMYANRHLGITGPESRGLAYGPVECEQDGRIVLAMDDEMIERVISKYVSAAAAAKASGFGMVTVHAGHGWLLSQFLSPSLNVRRDKWGGADVENRARLAVTVCDAIRREVGPRFPIEVRISGSECYPGGYGIDEGIAIARQLDGHCDIIHVSAGSHEVDEVFTVTHPSMFLEDGCNVKYAAEIKKHVSAAVATVGALGDGGLMEDIIASGKADIVEIARGLLADPDLPNKLRAGRDGEVRKCMRCLSCFSNLLTEGQFRCAINPETGREHEYACAPAPVSAKTVLIAGGGVGGMQAALTCAGRGHRVILCERSGELGGALRCERNVPFKANLDRYLNRQAELIAQSSVEVRLNTPVTPELARALAPDVIIAATGASPVRPPIDGIDLPCVLPAESAYINPELTGERVVILGAGLVGTELGIYLAMLGRRITIVEMLDRINDGGNFLHAKGLQVQIKKYGIDLILSTRAEKITANGVVTAAGEIECDTVIYAVGQKPNRASALALYDCAPEFHILGDCVSPRNIMNATSSAEAAARGI